MSLSKTDSNDLHYAKSLLEHPGLAMRVADLVGVPIEAGVALLPASAGRLINTTTKKSLQIALHFALVSMRNRPLTAASTRIHKVAAAAVGAGGGAFGLAALPVELPVSTLIMLRSIADIARSEGELITSGGAKLACLEVFALGGRKPDDDAVDSSYFAVRAALANSVTDAARCVAEKKLASDSAPAIVRFITRVAAYFQIAVSEKVAAQAIPLIGAAGGALINTLFTDHFQAMARGHFIVRRLERAHGSELVKQEYMKV